MASWAEITDLRVRGGLGGFDATPDPCRLAGLRPIGATGRIVIPPAMRPGPVDGLRGRLPISPQGFLVPQW